MKKKNKAKSEKSALKQPAHKKKASAKEQAGQGQPSVVNLDDAALAEKELHPSPPSPDDEGLSRTASADSESVDELLDEGNAFEAGIVSGVERADNPNEKEVRTREVPEDDVPAEYLDNEP